MFCGTAVTIISGATAERMYFPGYIIVSIIVSLLIYPIFGHWAWNVEGWLNQLGFRDFAGATVVQSVGGWAALAVLFVIGPRKGRFEGEKPQEIPKSNLPIAMMGVIFLWVGWVGFNGGSTLEFNLEVLGVISNTILAGGAGLIGVLVWEVFRSPRVNVDLLINDNSQVLRASID